MNHRHLVSIGQHFGRWTVTEEGAPKIHGKVQRSFKTWTCRCDCGTVKDVLTASLVRGLSTSCGCYRSEQSLDRIRTLNKGGSLSPRWKGGRQITKRGYVDVWIHRDHQFFVMARSHTGVGGYVFEHRLVFALHLGRALRENEEVHHIDTDRRNNAIGNLQLRIVGHGTGAAFACLDCGSCNVAPVELKPPLRLVRPIRRAARVR